MTDAAVFAAALGHAFDMLGEDGWLSTKVNADTAVKAIVTVPGREEMVGDGPTSLDPDNRFIDLPTTAGATTGDLVTVSGSTWILSRSADSDSLGLSRRWIGVPFGRVPALAFSYHASGYPLVTWNGTAWVAP